MWATVPGPRQELNRKHCGPQSMCWHALGSTLATSCSRNSSTSILQAVRALSTVYGASYGRLSLQSATLAVGIVFFLAMMSRLWLLEGAKGLV
jgi:hypothetical protein